MGLTFKTFSRTNMRRCSSSFPAHEAKWNPTYYSNALAGEVGEVCNVIKKLRRGDPNISNFDAVMEIADVVTYADLLCQFLGYSLEDVLCKKFNIVSERVQSSEKL